MPSPSKPSKSSPRSSSTTSASESGSASAASQTSRPCATSQPRNESNPSSDAPPLIRYAAPHSSWRYDSACRRSSSTPNPAISSAVSCPSAFVNESATPSGSATVSSTSARADSTSSQNPSLSTPKSCHETGPTRSPDRLFRTSGGGSGFEQV